MLLQNNVKVLAFADDCVLRIADITDFNITAQSLDEPRIKFVDPFASDKRHS